MTSPATENPGGAPQRARPEPQEIRAELERILASECFRQAGRASEFLRFVVERTLAGEGDRLKGYTIAIDVFGRPDDFDAQSDPLVRVEAGRLRRRLVEYYASEGRSDPLRIELPRGGYTPQFRYMAPSAGAAESVRPRKRVARRRRRNVAALAAAALLLAVIVVQWSGNSVRAPAETAADAAGTAAAAGPRVLVLPFENLSGNSALDYFADGITEEIMLRLADLKLSVVPSQTGWYGRERDRSPEAEGAQLNARYLLAGNVRQTPERVRIAARLVDVGSGTQLWADAYDQDLSVQTLLEIQEKIARQVAATIAVPYGPIFEQELARARRKRPSRLDTYDCVLKYYSYRRTLDAAQYRDTIDCFQQAVRREPTFADAWAGLALMYLDAYAFGYGQEPTSGAALEQGGEAARTALDIDGESLLANVALARARFFNGDFDGFERSVDRVVVLAPNDVETLALMGALETIGGALQRGVPLLDKALSLSPRPPQAYYLGRALIELRADRADAALDWALKIDTPMWFIAPMIVAAAAGLSSRDDVAQRAVVQLLELYPAFPEHASAELGKWHLDEKLESALLSGLRAAGLPID